jgi:hypothetical protein
MNSLKILLIEVVIGTKQLKAQILYSGNFEKITEGSLANYDFRPNHKHRFLTYLHVANILADQLYSDCLL